jgi:hypothetical protein
MLDWVYQYPFSGSNLPSGRRSWDKLVELFESDPIFLENKDGFCQIIADGLNTILASKYERLRIQMSWDVHPVYVEIKEKRGYISVRDVVTRKDVGFDAMNEQIALYVSIINAVRIVGGKTYQKPFKYDREDLLSGIEAVLVEDFEKFVNSILLV